jgi:hypothetical protein
VATSWFKRSTGGIPYGRRVGYGDGKFIAMLWLLNQFLVSTDGENWTTAATTMPFSGEWTAPVWNGTTWVALRQGNSNTLTTTAATSPDGLNWTARVLPVSGNWKRVIWAGGGIGLFIGVSGTGRVVTSPDGETWTDRTANFWANANGIQLIDLAYSPTLGKVVVVSSTDDSVFVTTDGVSATWEHTGAASMVQIAEKNGVFLIARSTVSADLLRSTNPTTWTQQASPAALDFRTVLATDDGFVLANTTGSTVAESPTGLAGSWNVTALTADGQGINNGASSGTTTVLMTTQTNRTTYIQGTVAGAAPPIDLEGFYPVHFGQIVEGYPMQGFAPVNFGALDVRSLLRFEPLRPVHFGAITLPTSTSCPVSGVRPVRFGVPVIVRFTRRARRVSIRLRALRPARFGTPSL